MFNPIDEVTRVKKASMMLLKRANVSNRNEYKKLDEYLRFLNLEKKTKWKSIKSDENNFEKKYKKFQLDVSKVKSNLSANDIKNLSLVQLPRGCNSTKSGKSTSHLTKKSAAPSNITKMTLKIEEGINEVARTNHVLFSDEEKKEITQVNQENSSCDYTDQMKRNNSSLNNGNFNYAEYYFNRLNTSESIQLDKKPTKSNEQAPNGSEDHVSIGLPSISTIKSNFQTQNLDSFYSTQLDDFNDSNYFQHLVEKRFAYKFKAKQMNKNKFSCHYN